MRILQSGATAFMRSVRLGLMAVTAVTAVGAGGAQVLAQTMETSAKNVVLIEAETNTILFQKEPDGIIEPSSMAKMMTIYLLFEKIDEGALTLDSTFTVSADAWRLWYSRRADRPSLMFLKDGEDVRIEDLIRGIIVSSGNDACTVVAEGLIGSESAFADWMTDKAQELGMTSTHFTNASGWPDASMYTSASDLAKLAQHLAEDFPDLYHYFGEKRFTYGLSPDDKPISQSNRNPLLFTVEGADGLKTGHAKAAGYGVTGSATRDDRRLILVASGMESSRARSRESQRLMEYGFRNFRTYKLFSAGQVVDDANVWLGDGGRVPLVTTDDVKVTMTRADRRRMKVTLAYEAPIPAPILEGQPLATVRITSPDMEDIVVPLVAGKSVGEETGFGRLGAAFSYLLFGSN